MAPERCPGQDQRFWKPEDVRESPCPHCGAPIEFWKDDPARPCPGCGRKVANPRFDTGCAKWCRYAEACLGPEAARAAPGAGAPAPRRAWSAAQEVRPPKEQGKR